MWHEARKQERRIKGMIVDYRKRAERRQDFYEKIQADPTQFIQIHGRRCKIHLDPAMAAAGDGAAIIVPWQGQQDNLIDRFDVRAHLDYIPQVSKSSETEIEEISQEERQCNYERYRILAQNDFLSLTEEKYLHQLYLEEQYGANAQLEADRNICKKKQRSGATIGYSYEEVDVTSNTQPFSHLANIHTKPMLRQAEGKLEKDSDSDSDSDIDMDVSIDITKLDTGQAHELNGCGRNYGMISNDFYSFLTKDADEADALRIAREEEQEKILLSGRKSRRERRAQKERRIACRPFSPPSYAAKEDPDKKEKEESESRSPSPSDVNAGKITFITSFGGEDELQPHSKISINIAKGLQTLGESCIGATTAAAAAVKTTYAQKVKENLDKLKNINERSRHSRSRSRRRGQRRRGSYSKSSRSRSRSRDRGWKRGRRSRSRSTSVRSRSHRHHRRSRAYLSSSRRRRYRSSYSSSSSSSKRSTSNSSRYGSRKKNYRSSDSRRKPASVRRSRSSSKIQSSPLNSNKATAVISAVSPQSGEKTTISNPDKTADAAAPMISYPTAARGTGVSNPPAAVEIAAVPQVIEPPPPPLKRYYGRKRGDDSSSTMSESDCAAENTSIVPTADGNDTEDNMDVDTASELSNPLPSSSTTGKQTGKYSSAQAKNPSFSNASEIKDLPGSSRSVNLRERLKRKMQILLNKQYKADKRAEIEKTEREKQLQQEREDEMRELALKLRRRQRELRHKYGTPSSGKETCSETSEPTRSHKSKHSKSRSCDRSISDRKPHRSVRSRKDEECTRRRSRSHSRSNVSRRSRRSRSRSDRHKKSRSRGRSSQRTSERSRGNYHRRSRSRQRHRDRDRARDRDRDRDRPIERERYNRSYDERGSSSVAATNSSRNKIVISAPPKLKKLVDY